MSLGIPFFWSIAFDAQRRHSSKTVTIVMMSAAQEQKKNRRSRSYDVKDVIGFLKVEALCLEESSSCYEVKKDNFYKQQQKTKPNKTNTNPTKVKPAFLNPFLNLILVWLNQNQTLATGSDRGFELGLMKYS